MSSPYRLFMIRLKKGWLHQYKIWKVAVDWIVWLYFLVPLLAILGYNYMLLYSGEVEWVNHLPLKLIWALLFFLSWTGVVRLFLEVGDVLFIRQNKRWLIGLMRFGIVYSLIKNFLFVSFVFALLLPFWLIYLQVTYFEIVVFFIFTLLFRICTQFLRQIVETSFQTWMLILMKFLLFLGTFLLFAFFYASSLGLKIVFVVLLVVAFYELYQRRMKMTWCFYEDCRREEQQVLKLTSLFIAAAGYKEEKRILNRKKPFICFPQSAQLFKNRSNENIIIEIFLKFFLRSKTRVLFLMQMTGMFTFALIRVPVALKGPVLIVCILSLIYFVRGTWTELKKQPFYKLYSAKEHDEMFEAVKKAICTIALPICFFYGFIAGITVATLLISIVIATASTLISYLFIKRALLI